MTGLRRLAVLLPFLIVPQAWADPGPLPVTPPPAPLAAVRMLQSLQDQIAGGDAAAQAERPKLMAHIADEFLAADPASWKDPRNTRAAVLFLLNGGKPSVIRTILSRSEMAPALDRLLKGALAYGEGQDDVARTLLEPVDPRTLPGSLGGQLALIQATLLGDRNAAKASRSLDLARLLMPGTLVEEAALRRQIFLLAAPDTTDKFAFLSRQYLRRFRASVYAANFRQRFAAAVIHLAETADVGHLAKLDAAMTELPSKDRRHLYLTMARAALTAGRTDAARLIAARAADPSDDPADYARAKLYDAAALVASDHVSEGLAVLNAIEADRLSADDASLREAAVTVGETVAAPAPVQTAAPAAEAGGAAGTADDASALIKEAGAAATAGDKLLQASTP